MINGRIVVQYGTLVGVEMRHMIDRHNAASLRMLRQAGYA